VELKNQSLIFLINIFSIAGSKSHAVAEVLAATIQKI
jgi:hypothetical protein